MLVDHSENKFIDLNSITSNTEISLNKLLSFTSNSSRKIKTKEDKFSFEEVEVNDSSSSIYYTQHSNKMLISVYGPRECRIRDKTKSDEAIVEVYTKFNLEINREKVKKLNGIIQNFCESLIFLDSFPRCQINICINIISFENENLLFASILNGLMLALSISGIDLKTFALTSCFSENERIVNITLDSNKPDNILLIDSNTSLKFNEYVEYIEKAQNEISELYKKFKQVLIKKLLK